MKHNNYRLLMNRKNIYLSPKIQDIYLIII